MHVLAFSSCSSLCENHVTHQVAICALPSGGMIMRDSYSTHPSSTLNSVFLVAYGLNSGPRLTCDQPCKHNFRTQDRTGSASVHFLM